MNSLRLLLFTSLLIFAGKNSIAQTLKTYKDAASHFEITIPANWLVTKSNPKLKFIAIRPQSADFKSVPENINLNFINAPNTSLDAAYAMSVESNSSLDGFISVTEKGNAANNRYKWYVDTHKDLQTEIVMATIVFVYYQQQKAVLLTCTASKESFEKFEPVFFKIADSLKL